MKLKITTLLLLIVSSAFSQIKLEGVVKDSIGNPLELANVIAINQETKSLDAYGITNDQGRYKLSLKKNALYKLQISYIGMKTGESLFESKDVDVTKNFTLHEDTKLDEINLWGVALNRGF